MHDLKSRRLRRSTDEYDELHAEATAQHPRHSHATWAAVAIGGAAVIGAGASMYGANKQSQANKDAQVANQQAQKEQNDQAWANWLASKGVVSTTPVSAGVYPTDYRATNVKLPYWANVSIPNNAEVAKSAGAPKGGFLRVRT